jgi:hypothetical protein
VERPIAGRQERDELVVDDLDHLLPGRQAVEDLVADGPLADPCDEALDDLELTSASRRARRTSRMAAST